MNTTKPPSSLTPPSREIRVFISSTFADMMEERDLLVKRVFPHLRKICAQRFVTFTEVDLRWGITEQQAAEGKVLPTCLAEINRCRPFFIGLLGDRYGWIPDEVAPELIREEPWLEEHVKGRISVTELEILHGVLNNPQMHSHAFFYFRAPGSTSEPREFEEKLADLKDRIRRSGLPVKEGYSSPEELADLVKDQFERLIDQIFPEADVPDKLDRERLAHEAHARTKLFGCVRRPGHMSELDDFIQSIRYGEGLAVTGESGCGKTALLADWALEQKTSHPDVFLFQHYIGSTTASAQVDALLLRLLGELKRAFAIDEEVPDDPDTLREVFPTWLARAAGEGSIILVLDGLNQIQGDDPDRSLAWFPARIPPRVSVVVTSLPGPALDRLAAYGWQEHHLPLAEPDEIQEMVAAYFDEYRKVLDPELRNALVNAPGSGNLLFLRTVMEELRQFGEFERLPGRVAHYLEADGPLELFRRVISRWQEDFDADFDLVTNSLAMLWAARIGLAESEWVDMLGDEEEPLPRAVWSALLLAMEPHLVRRAGLLTFGHDFLRQAVALALSDADYDLSEVHNFLALYFFHNRETNPRFAEEYPWQLQEAENWEVLQRALVDRELFIQMLKENREVELRRYWVRLMAAEPGTRLDRIYLEASEAWVENEEESELVAHLFSFLGWFLDDMGYYPEAETLYRRAREVYEATKGPDDPAVKITLLRLAHCLMFTNRASEAEELLNQVLETEEKSEERADYRVAQILHTLALIYINTHRARQAESLLRKSLVIAQRHEGTNDPNVATIMTSLGELLVDIEEFEEGGELLEESLRIKERALGRSHPGTAYTLARIAELRYETGRLEEAEPLFRESLETMEHFHGPWHVDVAGVLSHFADLLADTDRVSEAESFQKRSLEINEKSRGWDNVQVAASLVNLAMLYKRTDRHAEAEPLLHRALEVYEKLLGPDDPEVATCLTHLAGLMQDLDRVDESEQLQRRALRIDEEFYGPDHPELSVTLHNLAGILWEAEKLAEAIPFMHRHMEIEVRKLRETGETPSYLEKSTENYYMMLKESGWDSDRIKDHMMSLGE